MNEVADLLQSLSFSTAKIATLSNLPLSRVQAIMEGAPVALAELRAMSQGLHIPMRAFAMGQRSIDRQVDVNILFRGAAQNKSANQLGTIEYVAAFIESAVPLLADRSDSSRWMSDLVPKAQTFEEAHRLAHQCRLVLMPDRLDEPAGDLPELLATRGDIVIGTLRRSRYEGASVRHGGHDFIFISPRFPARMLFTLAHEFGHVISHHGDEQAATFDTISSIGSWKSRSLNERFVDTFASILLLPDNAVGLALKYIREAIGSKSSSVGDIEILFMARYFGVSFDVAARRCEQLELLPDGGAQSLADTLRKEFKSPERRAEDLGIPARPIIKFPILSENLLRPLVQSIRTGALSTGWASERFGISINEIFEAHARFNREHRH